MDTPTLIPYPSIQISKVLSLRHESHPCPPKWLHLPTDYPGIDISVGDHVHLLSTNHLSWVVKRTYPKSRTSQQVQEKFPWSILSEIFPSHIYGTIISTSETQAASFEDFQTWILFPIFQSKSIQETFCQLPYNRRFDNQTRESTTGMRLMDVGILSEEITKLKCADCSGSFCFFEIDSGRGWQTSFSIRCIRCHLLFVEFPSSKPMGIPAQSQSTLVNVHHPERAMNEVTMFSVLTVHCSGFSWRDSHKFATIFGMLPSLSRIPQRFLNKIENIVKNACQMSMTAVADDLHLRADAVPSLVPNCINIAVSFDSSWKIRGFYSNVGFGSAISTTTKKVLSYVLLNCICEKCARWSEKRKDNNPEAYHSGTNPTTQLPQEF